MFQHLTPMYGYLLQNPKGKVRPLNRALQGAAAWVTGLRREQSQGRAHVPTGFLHLPANAEVALAVSPDRPPLPYLPQEELTRAVLVAAEALG